MEFRFSITSFFFLTIIIFCCWWEDGDDDLMKFRTPPSSSSSVNALTTTTTTTTRFKSHRSCFYCLPSSLYSTTKTINDFDTSTTIDDDDEFTKKKQHEHYDIVVCGAGPSGLLCAIMLAQQQPSNKTRRIHVFDVNPNPPYEIDDESIWNDNSKNDAKFYSLGIFGRGKIALEKFGLWDDVVRPYAQELVGSQVFRSSDFTPTTTNTTIQNNSSSNNNPSSSSSSTSKPTLYNETIPKRESIYALPRDKLVSALYGHIQTTYDHDQVIFHFGQQITPIDFEYENGIKVLLEVSSSPSSTKSNSTTTNNTRLCTTNFLIGADGAARTVANRMEEVERNEFQQRNPIRRFIVTTVALLLGRRRRKPFSITRFIDDNPRVYKTIPIQLPSNWRKDIGYTFSDFPNRRYNIVTLPSNTDGSLCGVLLMKQDEPLAKANTNPVEFRQMLDDHVPIISTLINDDVVEAVAKKPVSQFPFYRYASPKLHIGQRTVILGDACHSVKPYNGVGVNSAFEDVQILSECLFDKNQSNNDSFDENFINNNNSSINNHLKDAVEEFSKVRTKDCKAIVTMSRASDRPGRWGKMKFIIPLLMDAYFHKMFPSIFEPPIPGLIHNPKFRFHQIVVRKRWERLAQISVLTLGTFLIVRSVTALVRRLMIARLLQVSASPTKAVLLLLVGPVLVGSSIFAQRRFLKKTPREE